MEINSWGPAAFKAVSIAVSVFYLLFSLVLGKQVRVMGRVVQDKANSLLYVVSSIQTTVAFILLIFSIFLI